MIERGRYGSLRQTAVLVGALLQALAGVFFVANLSADPVADERGATLIDPAGYAFFVWALILLLCLAYAVYQAFPSRRDNVLFARIGWPLAGAFFLNGMWEIASPLGRLGVAQILIAGILALLAVAYLRLAREVAGRTSSDAAQRWLVGTTVGVYFGWITAANAVSLTSLAARSGLVGGGGFDGAVFGAALLVLGTAFACAVILIERNGYGTLRVAYAGTVLWALVGIVANQYAASALTTTVACLCAVLVVAVLVGANRMGPGSRGDAGGPAPRVV